MDGNGHESILTRRKDDVSRAALLEDSPVLPATSCRSGAADRHGQKR